LGVALFLGALAIASAKVYFVEEFDSTWADRWVHSSWKASDGNAGKFERTAGTWYGDKERDTGIATTSDLKFYDISAKFEPFSNEGKDLVLQYTLKFPQKIDCGGGYLKLLFNNFEQESFGGDTDYAIMFGPDICGYDEKIHIIFNYKGEGRLWQKKSEPLRDQLTHLYTLVVHPDNTFELYVDQVQKASGNLEEEWKFLPPKEINDETQSKPADWVETESMDDPEDKKPEGFDAITPLIGDPNANKPDDWDEDEEGEWEAPKIPNPEYKGEWIPKKIANPDYKGKWVHPKIENPEYASDPNIYKFDNIGGIGIDVWQVKAGTIFDNILVADSLEDANAHAEKTWAASKDAEAKAFKEFESSNKKEAKVPEDEDREPEKREEL